MNPGNVEQSVGKTEVGDRPVGIALEQLQSGEEPECRDEKGNFQQQRNGPAQRVVRLVVVLTVEGLQHHEALVAFEYLFDVVDSGLQLFEPDTFLLLHGVRASVEGKNQQINCQTQGDN